MTAVGKLLIGAVSLLSACGSHDAATSSPSHIASATCPLRTPSDWQTFQEDGASHDEWGMTCSDRNDCTERVGDFTAAVQGDLLPTLTACREDLAQNPSILRCTERLRRFVPAWLAQHDPQSYGFALPTHDYQTAQTAVENPRGMMEPPPELIAAWPNRDQMEALARLRGWAYLEHESCLGGMRLFIRVQDEEQRFDQWLLFGFDPTAATPPAGGIVSFIAVQKQSAAGVVLQAPRLHFRDYVVSAQDSSRTLALPETTGGKCYACHLSGLRQLAPFAGASLVSARVRGEPGYGEPEQPDFARRRLDDLNEALLAYGLPDWNATILPADHGPALGVELGCPTCHDGTTRGALSVLTSEGQLYQKTVEQLSMRSPHAGQAVPDTAAMELLERDRTMLPPLSDAEAASLMQARKEHEHDFELLMQQRLPALRDWLLAERCDQNEP